MYCSKCGNELPVGAVFCEKCGTAVSTNNKMENENEENFTAGIKPIKKNTISDNIEDKILSKITKQNIKTVRVSMEDMLRLLDEHFIKPSSTNKEYKKIQKTINGGMFGTKTLVSKDENYRITVSVVFRLGGRINLLHPSDSNWIIFKNQTTGECYQYSAFFWGKFKKNVKKELLSKKM
ncbi:MAG: zinc ribbon domain-containing protein [Roseburia sp.]|nr:zinc ribbon domain-containing protein [Roseburia sp.]